MMVMIVVVVVVVAKITMNAAAANVEQRPPSFGKRGEGAAATERYQTHSLLDQQQ